MKYNENLLWAAGLFEAEGSVFLDRRHNLPHIEVTMADHDVVESFAAAIGFEGSINFTHRSHNLNKDGTPHKDLWRVSASGTSAVRYLSGLAPYLRDGRKIAIGKALTQIDTFRVAWSSLPIEARLPYAAGLMEGDGKVNTNRTVLGYKAIDFDQVEFVAHHVFGGATVCVVRYTEPAKEYDRARGRNPSKHSPIRQTSREGHPAADPIRMLLPWMHTRRTEQYLTMLGNLGDPSRRRHDPKSYHPDSLLAWYMRNSTHVA